MRNTEPPAAPLSTEMRPPFTSTAHLAIDRPRPVPPLSRAAALVDAKESIEDPLAMLGRDTGSFVDDLEESPDHESASHANQHARVRRPLYLMALSSTLVIASRSTSRSAVAGTGSGDFNLEPLMPLLRENASEAATSRARLAEIDRFRGTAGPCRRRRATDAAACRPDW